MFKNHFKHFYKVTNKVRKKKKFPLCSRVNSENKNLEGVFMIITGPHASCKSQMEIILGTVLFKK